MDQQQDGIRLSNAELAALLPFCATQKASPELAGVALHCSDGAIEVFASDGKASCVHVETRGSFELGTHRWFLPRAEVELAIKATRGAKSALFHIQEDNSIGSYTILGEQESEDDEDDDSSEEVELQTVVLTTPAEEDLQLSFPVEAIGKSVHPSDRCPKIVSAQYHAGYMVRLALIAKAVMGGPVRLHFPELEGQPLVITAGVVDQTQWAAAIMPLAEDGEEKVAPSETVKVTLELSPTVGKVSRLTAPIDKRVRKARKQ